MTSERSPETPRTFRAIYDAYFDFVWRFAANCGVPSSSLEELTREVFANVHTQLDGTERATALRTGIAGVARSAVQSCLRKRTAPPAGRAREPAPTYRSGERPAFDQPEPAERRSAGEVVETALGQMKELQREAFVLCEMEGLSVLETAAVLGLNEPTLRAHLHDARRIFNAASAHLRAQRFWVSREPGKQP